MGPASEKELFVLWSDFLLGFLLETYLVGNVFAIGIAVQFLLETSFPLETYFLLEMYFLLETYFPLKMLL